MKRRRKWSGLAVAVAVVGGCGGNGARGPGGQRAAGLALADPSAAPGDLASLAPFAAPGERMSYRLSIHGIEVAAFAIAVGDPVVVQGRNTVVVQAGVQSTGIAALFKQVRTDFASWIDLETGRPVVSRVVETAGADDPAIETSEARFHAAHDGLLPIAMTAPDGTETVEDQAISASGVWDVPSILMYLRGWDDEVGTEMTAQVVRSRYVWRGQFRIVDRELKSTELGQLPTLRIDGLSRRLMRDGTWEPKGDTRKFSVWVTDDADRVPVLIVGRTDFGDLKMEIVGFTPGGANLRGRAVAGAELAGRSSATP